MKNVFWKKIISIILSLCMIASLNVAAFADDGQEISFEEEIIINEQADEDEALFDDGYTSPIIEEQIVEEELVWDDEGKRLM